MIRDAAVSRGRWRLLSVLAAALVPAAFVALTGCNNSPMLRGNGTPPARIASSVPTAADLVRYLNDNARRMQTLECRELLLDASHRMQAIGLRGQLACQKPKNFRMVASAAGQPAVDMGSNNLEFWYWISKADPPYLFHCTHLDFNQGRARMPFPFQPDWVVEALGMGEYDPTRSYEVVAKPQTLELIESATSPQGRPVKKVTVFNRAPSAVQVTAHILLDAAGKEICAATIQEAQQDARSGAVYPRRVQLVWPAEHIKLKMKLDDTAVNGGIDDGRAARLFTRPALRDIHTYNLALSPEMNGVRPVGGR